MGWVDDISDSPKSPSRRSFLRKAAGVGVAALMPKIGNAWGFDRGNAFDVLKDYNFRDQNGNLIKGEDLKDKIDGHDFTVALSLNSCATGICTPENMNLAQIKNTFPDVKHIVINANPEVEGVDQNSRDDYAATIAHGSIPKENLIVLYPLSTDSAQSISGALGNVTLTGADHVMHHSAVISLYDKNGDFKDCLLADSMRAKNDIMSLKKYDGACR